MQKYLIFSFSYWYKGTKIVTSVHSHQASMRKWWRGKNNFLAMKLFFPREGEFQSGV